MNAASAAGALPRGIAILGPTGSGKSALAMRVAAALPVEIISVDSAQVYRGLDIGTAKPGAAERRAVAHHLLDIRAPEQVYSAGEFRADCLALIHAIALRGRVPLLVGGTMLYYRALFGGIAALPRADAALRAALDARAAREGWPALHAELAARDPAGAARIHPHDAQRIQRALEVLALSGRVLDAHWSGGSGPAGLFAGWKFCLLEPHDRARLHAALAARLDVMLRDGFVAEVQGLLGRGLPANAPVLRLVGYRQLAAYCRGQESLQAATGHALAATRQLAKRQLTWMRGGGLLPYGATVLRTDPFDLHSVAATTQSLIEGLTPP
ncbi:MAG TPA: tRNA (adenosine(37)-N6)-dimethylallyltransferase MiaA [Steroidobacteraceae bacterium]|nr:tRNA (adenosine(37)-N6)-dimethylallyltransferase MiaA [Steroidobacteraceae bacterium]